MMNHARMLLLFILVSICITFASCSTGEADGVPDAALHDTEVYVDFANDCTITDVFVEHNVDTSTHIDSVCLMLHGETEYATLSNIAYLKYQYEKSNDLWHLIEIEHSSRTIEYKNEAFVDCSPWQGEIDNYKSSQPDCYYTFYVDAVDFLDRTITIRYQIDYVNDQYSDVDITQPVVLPLERYPSGTSYWFYIDEADGIYQFYITPYGIQADSH